MSRTGPEIKKLIDENNKLIEQSLTPNIWTLNNSVAELLEENKRLQKECSHEYENGACIYCYKLKEK